MSDSDRAAKREKARQRRLTSARELEERGQIDTAVQEFLRAKAPEEAARALASKGRLADAGQAILDGLGVEAGDVGQLPATGRTLAEQAAVFFEQGNAPSKGSAIREALASAGPPPAEDPPPATSSAPPTSAPSEPPPARSSKSSAASGLRPPAAGASSSFRPPARSAESSRAPASGASFRPPSAAGSRAPAASSSFRPPSPGLRKPSSSKPAPSGPGLRKPTSSKPAPAGPGLRKPSSSKPAGPGLRKPSSAKPVRQSSIRPDPNQEEATFRRPSGAPESQAETLVGRPAPSDVRDAAASRSDRPIRKPTRPPSREPSSAPPSHSTSSPRPGRAPSTPPASESGPPKAPREPRRAVAPPAMPAAAPPAIGSGAQPQLSASGEAITDAIKNRESGWRAAGGEAIELSIEENLKAGRKGAAARIARDAGQFERALGWFRELGLHTQTGACLRALERWEEAIEALLLEEPGSGNYRKACFELVPVAVHLDRIDFEVDRFFTAFIEEGPRDRDEIPTYLELARLYVAADFHRGARRCIAQVLAVDSEHAGARALKRQLDQAAAPAPPKKKRRPSLPPDAQGLPAMPTLEEFVALAREYAPE